MASKFAALICRLMWPRRGGVCPECGAPVPAPAPLRDPPWETVVRCGCGWAGSFHGILKNRHRDSPSHSQPAPAEGEAGGHRVPLPPDSGITHADGIEETWSLPRSGRSRGFLLFGILWLCISIPAAIMLWWHALGQTDFLLNLLARAVFGIGFPIIGLSLLYAGLRMKYARHWLSLSEAELTLERELFGRRKRKSLRRTTITRVELREFYTQNYQPVYGIEVRGADGKLRFGTSLTDGEKAWLEQDLRRALGLPGEAAGGTEVEPGTRSALSHTPALEIEETRSAVTLRITPKKSDLAGLGLILMTFSAVFLAVASAMMWGQGWSGGFLGTLAGIYMIPFAALPLLFLAIGWITWREGRRLSKTVTVLSVDAAGITLEKLHPRHRTMDRIGRGDVQRVQTSSFGAINRLAVMHLEIVTAERVIILGFGSPAGDVAAMCTALRRALGLSPQGNSVPRAS